MAVAPNVVAAVALAIDMFVYFAVFRPVARKVNLLNIDTFRLLQVSKAETYLTLISYIDLLCRSRSRIERRPRRSRIETTRLKPRVVSFPAENQSLNK